jgi:ribonuclease J
MYASGQNIDRIVSVYRACIRTTKILVVDVYVATILKVLSKFAGIPYPSNDFQNLKVMFPYFLSRRLKNEETRKFFINSKTTKSPKMK